MNDEERVLAAAEARASALAEADAERLTALLHPDFRWTSHVGETFDRREYVRRNTEGETGWRSQRLTDAEAVVVGDTAVLYAVANDVVEVGRSGSETFAMPMTQVWVREGRDWRCLAGHAGPRRASGRGIPPAPPEAARRAPRPGT